MEPEEKELLKKGVELAEENNKILHSIKRSLRISNIVRFIYWTFIIGSAVGAYYFVQPYFEEIYSIYGGSQLDFKSFNEMIQDIKN
jgi:hypothetical protein